MNARSPVPPTAPISALAPRRADRDFLPAALEILETPPSPVRVALIWTTCLFVTAVLAWSWIGRLDVVASAQGKIQPTGRVKVIQPIETGRVSTIRVENGQRVARGDELVTFDTDEADADANALAANLAASQAEASRRRAALAGVSARTLTPAPAIDWTGDIPRPIRTRETLVLAGDLVQLSAQVSSLAAQQAQKRLETQRLDATIAAQSALIAALQQRVDMRSALERGGSGSKAVVIDAMEPLLSQQTSLAASRGQLAESAAAAAVLGQDIERSYATFAAENLQKLAEAERQADDLEQKLAKARVRQRRMVLASPIDGTVSALTLTTIGQVVGAGDEIMRVVPDGIGIEIECYILNRDIGFVRMGQEAIVKVDSLPFTRYGTVGARLIRIGGDAIPQPDADQTEINVARTRQQRGFAGSERTQNLVFPATLRPDTDKVMADDVAVPLSPGMTVTVEIKTGSRRILEFVFSPLFETAARAMKER